MFLFNVSYAQRYEIGLFVGGNNVIGDINDTYYVNPSGGTIGGLFKWNVSERLAVRGNMYYSLAIGSNDNFKYPSGIKSIPEKGYSKNIGSTELLLEWNFIDYNLRKDNAHAPFAFIGVGGVFYESVSKDINDLGKDSDTSFGSTISIPFGVGYKYAITKKIVLAADLSFRYTYSDNLDDSNPSENKDYTQVRIGNLNSNDWLTTVGVTLTYVFGRDPCACKQ